MDTPEVQTMHGTFLLTTPMPRRAHAPRAPFNQSVSLQLKKSKQEADNAKRQLDEMVKRLHKLEFITAKHQKLSMMAKTKCMKLYEVKKHKLVNRTLQEESRHRKQLLHDRLFQQTQRKRLEQEAIKDTIRSHEQQRRMQARDRIINYKKTLYEELEQSQNNLYESCRRMAEEVKRSKSRFADRKKLIEEITLDKGRENYLAKLKQEFRSLQVYKDKIADLEQESREVEELSKVLAKYSRDSQRKTGATSNNMSFFVTQKRSDEKKSESCRK